MAQPEKRKALLTPMFRVAFPQIIGEAKAFQPGQKPRWSLTALFSPGDFTEVDKTMFKALMAELNKVTLEGFKKPYKDLDRAVYKRPFHDGAEKEHYAGFGKGVVYCTMAAYTRPPGCVDKNNQRIDPSEIYPGCYVRASVNPFVNVQWKSISIGINNIQKLREGERLDGATTAEEDFGSEPAEYGDDLGLGGESATEDEFAA